MKLEEERYQKNFISYVDTYYNVTLTYEQKGLRQLHHDFNKQKINHQTSYYEDYFIMTFS